MIINDEYQKKSVNITINHLYLVTAEDEIAGLKQKNKCKTQNVLSFTSLSIKLITNNQDGC